MTKPKNEPRRWSVPEIKSNFLVGDFFVEASAYDAIEKERDELKEECERKETFARESEAKRFDLDLELQRERRKVEKLREQRNQALGQNYAWQYKKLDAELEAIDKGEA